MSLIQICPDEEPSLAQLQTVGDARRKKYLARAIAREEERAARRPFSAVTHAEAPSRSSTISPRCISASPTAASASSWKPPTTSSPLSQPPISPSTSAALTSASPLSTPWTASSSVATRSTCSKEPNLSDTLANTITSDMAVLRRRPSTASHGLGTPPKARAATLRASSARSHSSAAAAIAAAALPAATLPRRPVSASPSAMSMAIQPHHNPDLRITQPVGTAGPGLNRTQDMERRDRSPRHTHRSAHSGSAATLATPASAATPLRPPSCPRPSTAAAAAAAARPPSPTRYTSVPLSQSASAFAAKAASETSARPPSPTRRSSVPLSRTTPASSVPSAQTSPCSSPQHRPASHNTPKPNNPTIVASSESHSDPQPTNIHTAPSVGSTSTASNLRPGSAAPAPSSPAAHANASNDLSRSGTRQIVRNKSNIGFRDVVLDGWASTAAARNQAGDDSQAKQRTAVAAATAAAAAAHSPSRPLPQWSVNARPFDNMLQFEGKDRNGFDTIAGRQGGEGVSRPAGSSASDVLRPDTQDQELPVGAVATAISLAQTSGSMDGLRDLRMSHLPTQVLQFLQTEGRLITGSLDFSHNDLASLRFLRHTPSITSLLVSHNRLVSLPAPVFNPVSCLQTLDLSNNKLEDLPSSLGSLRNLRHLDASNNNLEVLPARFSELTSLVTLKLNHNRLFCLPQGMGSLTSLEYLAAVGNSMTGLPTTLGCCSRLAVLELQQNSLTALPNSLKGLHTWLLEMHLDDNGITVLPREVALLTKLTNLTLSGNPLLFPPQAVAKGGAESVRDFLAAYSTPGTSIAQPGNQSLDQDGGEAGQDTANLDQKQGSSNGSSNAEAEAPLLVSSDQEGNRGGLLDLYNTRKAAGGYQPHERTDEDVVASTHVQCQGYNPEKQGSLLLHMQFEAEEHERQMRQMQLRVASSEHRAAIAERDAAELAETLRHTITEGNVTPKLGTVYEQGSAELARAVRVLEAELRETSGELRMARQQLEEARRSEAEQHRLADAATRDAGTTVLSVQRATALEAELATMQAKQADLQEQLRQQLHEYKNMEDRYLKAESQLESTVLGKHGAVKSELQGLREHVLVSKLDSSAAEEAAQAREAELQAQIAQLEASLEASRMTMRDLTDSHQAAARVLQVAPQPANFYASSWEQEAKKRRDAVINGLPVS